jgi:flagellar hook-associated protein 3 FlgL
MRFSLTPDLLFHTRQSRQNAELRARLETVGQEAITGRREDVVRATNGRVGDAFLLQKASMDITRQRETAQLAKARIDGAAGSIETIRQTLIDISADGRATLVDGGPGDFQLLSETASDRLGQVMIALGRRSGTRHLFGGTNTAGGPLASQLDLQADINAEIAGAPNVTSAIAAIDDYFNLPGGGFETNIYSGSVEDGPRLHVTDTQSYDPIPKADNALFRDVMRGFAMIAGGMEYTDDADRVAMMEAGVSILEGALDGAVAMETRLGATQQSIERLQTTFEREANLIATAEFNLLGRDTFDAAAELQALEGQLEASYAVTGRIGSFSLVNFLR